MKNPVRTGTMIALAAAGLFAAACGSKARPEHHAGRWREDRRRRPLHGHQLVQGHRQLSQRQERLQGPERLQGQGVTDAASADECTSKGGTVAAGH